jgi:DNA-binding PadR family transcriptional regulator
MSPDLQKLLPLSPATLHILLALAGEDRHGYGIMQEVARQSGGKYKLGPGTLYENLQKFLEQGIVAEVSSHLANDDSRRRYYRLSKFGRDLLSAEIARLEGVVLEAKAHLGMRPRRAS